MKPLGPAAQPRKGDAHTLSAHDATQSLSPGPPSFLDLPRNWPVCRREPFKEPQLLNDLVPCSNCHLRAHKPCQLQRQ